MSANSPSTDSSREALRRVQTEAERKLWSPLRSRRLYDVKFRRQYPLGRYIVDFCCPERQLVIEIDGGVHRKTYLQDRARDQVLMGRGYRVLRFWNSDVLRHTDRVMRRIALALRTPSPVPSPPKRGGGKKGM